MAQQDHAVPTLVVLPRIGRAAGAIHLLPRSSHDTWPFISNSAINLSNMATVTRGWWVRSVAPSATVLAPAQNAQTETERPAAAGVDTRGAPPSFRYVCAHRYAGSDQVFGLTILVRKGSGHAFTCLSMQLSWRRTCRLRPSQLLPCLVLQTLPTLSCTVKGAHCFSSNTHQLYCSARLIVAGG